MSYTERLLHEQARFLREQAEKAEADLAACQAEAARLRETAEWAIDLIDMYDKFLISLGQPEEKVYSEVHKMGKIRAYNTLRYPAPLSAAYAERIHKLEEAANVLRRVDEWWEAQVLAKRNEGKEVSIFHDARLALAALDSSAVPTGGE